MSADVSNNGVISSFDAAEIAAFVAAVPGGATGLTGIWKFFLPPGPTFPIGASPTSRSYASVSGNLTGEDFVGLLLGDVSGNWINTGARASDNEGPEREIGLSFGADLTGANKEITVPVNVKNIANKKVISYEFDLRYDSTVIQPMAEPVDVTKTVSRGLLVVTNPYEAGMLRVVVYGPIPIDENGVLLNLKFTAVGQSGSVSPLTFERIMFNEGKPLTAATAGQIKLIDFQAKR